MRREAAGEETRRAAKSAWAIVTVQGILDNDFYIGTFRQGKTTRVKINGKDVARDESEHIVIENHHQPIIDYRTFATTRALRESRSRSHYRGVKKYDNVYSGFLQCGDCGSPMFAMSRSDLAPAYTCGTYHRRGTAGCTSHHIRADRLDELMKLYVRRVMESSASKMCIRDSLYGVITMAWMYATPIFYPMESVDESIQAIIRLNPLYHYINLFRNLVIYGSIPGPNAWFGCIASSVVAIVIGLLVFNKLQKNFILHI